MKVHQLDEIYPFRGVSASAHLDLEISGGDAIENAHTEGDPIAGDPIEGEPLESNTRFTVLGNRQSS